MVMAYNGNGQLRHSISVEYWNEGNKPWRRKTDIIEALVLEKRPDLLFITEANLMLKTPEHERTIPGYEIILPQTMNKLKYARIILLVRQGMEVKVLNQYMPEDLATIWVKVGQQGRKPLVVGGIYREQHLLLPEASRGTRNLTGTPALQLERWRRMVKIGKTAARHEKCIVTGDLNLDFVKWLDPEPRHSSMVDLVKTEIEVEGFCQLIKTITRSWPNQEDSIVDHVWTNSVDRVISHMNSVRAGSDHNTISVRVRMKDRNFEVQEVEKRLRKNLNHEKLVNDLKKTGLD